MRVLPIGPVTPYTTPGNPGTPGWPPLSNTNTGVVPVFAGGSRVFVSPTSDGKAK